MPPQFDDDDELLEGIDDDDSPPADPEFEQKYAEFMREVDKHISVVMKPKLHKPAERLESIRMLGELGEIKAIKSLVMVYQRDKTPGIKEAAAKSLSLFKALQEAIEDEDEDIRSYANTLMDGIVRRREIGKSARLKPRTLRMVVGLLALSAVVLFGLGFVMGGGDGGPSVPVDTPTPENSPTPNPLTPGAPNEVAKLLSAYYIDLSQDVNTLQTQIRAVSQDYQPDCSVEFKNPTLVVLPESLALNERLSQAAGTLTEAGATVSPIRDAFLAVCASGTMTRIQAGDFIDALTGVQTSMVSVPTGLSSIGIVVPPTSTPMSPTPPPTNTPTATITETPIPPQLISVQRTGLTQLINMMSSTRGYNSLLLVYWTDVMTSGSTAGCLNLPAPTLPDDYILPANLDQVVPELGRAVMNVNAGLELSRASWGAFEAACNAENLADMAVEQQQMAQTAQDSFKAAAASLEDLDN